MNLDPQTPTSIAALIISLVALIAVWAQGKKHKLIDVTLHFQEAYDQLEMRIVDVNNEEEANYWFNRFWNLQARQYEYWLNGFIEDDIFIYWIGCRRNEIINNGVFKKFENGTKSYTFKSGWENVKVKSIFKSHPYSFVEFIQAIIDIGDTEEMKENLVAIIIEKKCEICGWRVKSHCWLAKVFAKEIYIR